MKTKYRNSRKKIVREMRYWWTHTDERHFESFMTMLLSTLPQEEKKEYEHKWRDAFADNGYFCDKCGMEVDNIPSLPELSHLLDFFEDIEEVDSFMAVSKVKSAKAINKLIRNQNRIINTLNKLIKQK